MEQNTQDKSTTFNSYSITPNVEKAEDEVKSKKLHDDWIPQSFIIVPQEIIDQRIPSITSKSTTSGEKKLYEIYD